MPTSSLDLYVHPKQSDSKQHNLLNDLIDYLLVKQQAAGDRRAAFLDTDDALIIDYQGFDVTRAKRVLGYMQKHQLHHSKDVLRAAQMVEGFMDDLSRLYTHVNVVFLTLKPSQARLEKIAVVLNKIYLLDQPIVPKETLLMPSDGVTLAEHALMHLQLGDQANVTSPSYQSNVLLHWLKHSSDATPCLQLLTIILKYQQLQCMRELLETVYTTPADAKALLAKDHLNKQIIFMASFDMLQTYLPHLPIPQILSLRKTPDDLILFLTKEKQDRQVELITFEERWTKRATDYKEPWGPWLAKKFSRAGQSAYDMSFMKTGADFFTWVAQHGNAYIPWQSPILHSGRALISTSVKISVFFLTFSTRLANHAGKGTQALLTEEGLQDLAKTLGNTLGAIANTSMGGFHLARMILMVAGTERLHHYLKSEQIDLDTATVSSSTDILPSMANLLRINVLLLTLINATYTQNPRLILQALSGMAGSVGFERLTDVLMKEFADDLPFALTPQDTQYLKLLVSISGMETGRYLSDSYLSMLDKMAADEAALRTIEKMMQNEPKKYTASLEDLMRKSSSKEQKQKMKRMH